ncbi:MAG: Asp-tRNA(Asn)/Glu-tRNA(Gln) amidotransferase GatCAB subunit C [Desulfobulbus propionicus]|nr:MAG: Asp-tRNA(Asn)/Glu-tRNA(Gln) amidotransferase GatCAB subunit C [Desulfobulbus propionicus]PIE60427.1 MAG: Asp-tRNA(Asn)/Glu-tRNA(Gln) amidotransferase GatCAB subunit C [Desulfobulbus propionicus]
MKISREEVQHVAKLARLILSEDETDRMTQQLDTLLHYMDKLEAVDTAGVSPTTHTQQVVNAFREDVVIPSLDRSKALCNAPEDNQESFVVPRVIR